MDIVVSDLPMTEEHAVAQAVIDHFHYRGTSDVARWHRGGFDAPLKWRSFLVVEDVSKFQRKFAFFFGGVEEGVRFRYEFVDEIFWERFR